MRFLERTAGRTLLLFVIRDHLGVTPLSNLSRTLQADITKIWDSISKPQDLHDRKLEDYFDLAFTALPHKVFIYACLHFRAVCANILYRFWLLINLKRALRIYENNLLTKKILALFLNRLIINVFLRTELRTIWKASGFDIFFKNLYSDNQHYTFRNKYKITRTWISQLNRSF